MSRADTGAEKDEIAGVSPTDRDRALAPLVLAFSADPFWRWMCPDAAQFLSVFPQALMLLDGRAFDEGSAWQIDDFAAVAVWQRPGADGDFQAAFELMLSTVAANKLEQVTEIAGQMLEMHPSTPCWHLSWLGADLHVQGRGLGTRLVEQGLELVDREHLPVYLESANPRNLSLYLRHGFEVIGEMGSGDSPPITVMLRPSA